MSADIVMNDGGGAVNGSIETTKSTSVQLSNLDDTGIAAWRWTLRDKPAGSAASISDTTSANPTITPDIEGTYIIELKTYTDAGATSLDDADVEGIGVRYVDGPTWRIPGAGETTQFNTSRGWADEVNKILKDLQDGIPQVYTEFQEQASDPASKSNVGFAYTKDVSGTTELFYLDSTGTAVQMTSGGGLGLHAARHVRGGADVIDGDHLDITYVPNGYTRSTVPSEADDVEHLASHLSGIGTELQAMLKTNGTRAMAAALDMGGFAITNVGNVDGRDVSADGAKLDGIEAGAEVNAVASVFGRTGAVVAVAGDYAASLINNDSGVAGSTVKAALDALDSGKADTLQEAYDGGATISGTTPLDISVSQITLHAPTASGGGAAHSWAGQRGGDGNPAGDGGLLSFTGGRGGDASVAEGTAGGGGDVVIAGGRAGDSSGESGDGGDGGDVLIDAGGGGVAAGGVGAVRIASQVSSDVIFGGGTKIDVRMLGNQVFPSDIVNPSRHLATFYNTADETTDYERARIGWGVTGADEFGVLLDFDGAATTSRTMVFQNQWAMRFNAGGATLVLDNNQPEVKLGSPGGAATQVTLESSDTESRLLMRGNLSGNAGQSLRLSNSGSLAGDSVDQILCDVTATIDQLNLASYTILRVNAVENGTGSGDKRLQEWQVDGTTLSYLENSGAFVVPSNVGGSGPTIGFGTSSPDTGFYENSGLRVMYSGSDVALFVSNRFIVNTGRVDLNGGTTQIRYGGTSEIVRRNAANDMEHVVGGISLLHLRGDLTTSGYAGVEITPEVNQSGTDYYDGVRVNVAETATGDGSTDPDNFGDTVQRWMIDGTTAAALVRKASGGVSVAVERVHSEDGFELRNGSTIRGRMYFNSALRLETESSTFAVSLLPGGSAGLSVGGGSLAAGETALDTLRYHNGSSEATDPVTQSALDVDGQRALTVPGEAEGAHSSMVHGSVQTSDATTIGMSSAAVTLDDDTVYWFEAHFVARDQGGVERMGAVVRGLFYREAGGSATLAGSTQEDWTGGPPGNLGGVDLGTSGNDVIPEVTGASSTTVDWHVTVRYQGASS